MPSADAAGDDDDEAKMRRWRRMAHLFEEKRWRTMVNSIKLTKSYASVPGEVYKRIAYSTCLNNTRRMTRVHLPPAEILSHETDDVTCVYEQQNIANPLKAGEESQWIEAKKTAMVERAESLGLYDEAEQNAGVTFESLFSEVLPEDATLDIRFQ